MKLFVLDKNTWNCLIVTRNWIIGITHIYLEPFYGV